MDNYVGGPYAWFIIAQLAGDAPNDTVDDDQAAILPMFVLMDIKTAARKALCTVEPERSHGNAFFTILQGETEACGSFLGRLTLAIERQCSDEQAHPHLVKILVFL